MNDLSQQTLKDRLHYDSETGIFTQIKQTSHRVKVGDRAGGFIKDTGYRAIYVEGQRYYEHRLVWLYVYGEWPPGQIDHINHQRDDNRLENLRSVTHQQNHFNRKNTKGFNWHKRDKAYRAYIQAGSEQHHLGYFKTSDDAREAYLKAKSELHHFEEAV